MPECAVALWIAPRQKDGFVGNVQVSAVLHDRGVFRIRAEGHGPAGMHGGEPDIVRLFEERRAAVEDVDLSGRAGPVSAASAEHQAASAGDFHEGGGRIVDDIQRTAGGLHVPAGVPGILDAVRRGGGRAGLLDGGSVGRHGVIGRTLDEPGAAHGQLEDRAVRRIDIPRLGAEADPQDAAGHHFIVLAGQTAGLELHISAAENGRRAGRAPGSDADVRAGGHFAFRGDAAGGEQRIFAAGEIIGAWIIDVIKFGHERIPFRKQFIFFTYPKII